MSEHIVREAAGGVMTLRLARPDKKNAITATMYRALQDGLEAAAADDATAAVLIEAEGDAFCAGNDIADFLKPGGADAAARFVRALAGFTKPIVAGVDGLAVGIGTTMLLHCDLVYATPAARFVTPFAKIGLVPEAASSVLLPARIGMAKATAMLLLGEPMDAEGAERAGLVTGLVAREGLAAMVRAKAAALAAMPPRALLATRRLMRGGGVAIEAGMAAEEAAFVEALAGAEAKEALTAFLEKRPPNFGQQRSA
jgi:enoyl-CoA hydratase/carnithine racemase